MECMINLKNMAIIKNNNTVPRKDELQFELIALIDYRNETKPNK